MKNLRNLRNISCIACILVLLCGCQEDERGQYPVSGEKPGKVTGARVEENIAGGSLIVYDIPKEEDALYVCARYMLDDGTPMELKSSVYTNKITIVGIGRSRELPVSLTVVDRSRNESDPVTVLAYPLDSPVFDLANSMQMTADFGGIRLNWDNPTKTPITIDVFSRDEDDYLTQLDRFYSQAPVGRSNLRGQESVETTFTVIVHDLWGNVTDPISGRFTPLHEILIPRSYFRRWNPPGIPYITISGWEIENLWANRLISPGFACDISRFTFDMGQVVKLSRFKLHHRSETTLCYNYADPKRFELWGSLTSNNVTVDISDWTFLGYFESFKPSGLPLGEVTSEDIAFAHTQGEDFNVEACPWFRYIRFESLETWGDVDKIQMMEMTFWGDLQEKE